MANFNIDEIEEARKRMLTRHIEPLDEDSIELLKSDFIGTYGRLNRLCNLLLLQPKGLGSGCIDALHDIKHAASRLIFYLEQRDKPVIRRNADNIRTLAEFCQHDPGPLGEAARSLLQEIPIGSET
jgi:hypothetical protein